MEKKYYVYYTKDCKVNLYKFSSLQAARVVYDTLRCTDFEYLSIEEYHPERGGYLVILESISM